MFLPLFFYLQCSTAASICLFVITLFNWERCLFAFQAEENLGMVMIFTLVSAVQEKLNEMVDQIKTRREEEKRQKEKEAEEAEKVQRKCCWDGFQNVYVSLAWLCKPVVSLSWLCIE